MPSISNPLSLSVLSSRDPYAGEEISLPVISAQQAVRLNRYREYWDFYNGDHWSQAMLARPEEPVSTINYAKKFADKHNAMLVGVPPVFRPDRKTDMGGLTDTMKKRIDFINETWEINELAARMWEMGQSSGVSGDAFLYHSFSEGTDLWPTPHVHTEIIPPEYCTPFYAQGRLVRMLVLYPSESLGDIQSNAADVISGDGGLWTETQFFPVIDGKIQPPTAHNVGVVPFSHIPNVKLVQDIFGISDLAGFPALNREFNEKITDISDIISYHCVDTQTEALTRRGWQLVDDLCSDDEILTLNPETDQIEWQHPDKINKFHYDGPMVAWDNRIDAVTTPNHRWLVERKIGRPWNKRYQREFARTSLAEGDDRAVPDLREGSHVIVGGGTPGGFADAPFWPDEVVETVGWYVTEGSDHFSPQGWQSMHLSQKNYVADIRRLAQFWKERGATFSEVTSARTDGVFTWYLGKGVREILMAAAPGKRITPEFLCSLTLEQGKLLRKVLVDGDGTRHKKKTGNVRTIWYQNDPRRKDGYQMLCAMLGIRTNQRPVAVDEYGSRTIETLSTVKRAKIAAAPGGVVWCPTVPNGVWFARRNGNTYWTGNSSPVTVIKGAQASSLMKGATKIWSGLPSDSDVFNLQLESDLAASNKHLDTLRMAMTETGDVPEHALGKLFPVSNTSAVAISLMNLPLLDHRNIRRIFHTVGLKRSNLIIFRIGEMVGLTPRGKEPADYRTSVRWGDSLPRNVQAQLEDIRSQREMLLMSREEALIELGRAASFEEASAMLEAIDKSEKKVMMMTQPPEVTTNPQTASNRQSMAVEVEAGAS